MPWWLRWIAYAVAVIVTFYTVEDIRGAVAWKKYLRAHPELPGKVNETGTEFHFMNLWDTFKPDYIIAPELSKKLARSRTVKYINRDLEFPLEPFRRSASWSPGKMTVEDILAIKPEGVAEPHAPATVFAHRVQTVQALALFESGRFEEAFTALLSELSFFNDFDDGLSILRSNDTSEDFMRCLQLVWQFLEKQNLDNQALEKMKNALREVDYLVSADRSVTDFSKLSCEEIEALKWNPDARIAAITYRNFHLVGDWRMQLREKLMKARRAICMFLMPNGWLDWNKIHLCRQMSRDEFIYSGARFSPLKFLGEEHIRFLIRCDPRPTEAFIRCSIAAIECEQHYLEIGSYPVAPDLPEDPFSPGNPLRYKVEKSRPVIYSIGPNLKDDGGKPRAPIAEGDLVWRYALPAGFTFPDYILH